MKFNFKIFNFFIDNVFTKEYTFFMLLMREKMFLRKSILFHGVEAQRRCGQSKLKGEFADF